MTGFREWLHRNRFDPQNTEYNYGYHPVGQVDLQGSFGTTDFTKVWPIIGKYLDIYKIETDNVSAKYDYTWSDPDYYQQQINMMKPGYDYSSRH
jgi:hypothetical protein